MKNFFLVSLISLIPLSAVATEPFVTHDSCINAAITETEKEFPINVKVTAKFFEWFSHSSSGWQTFTNIRNLGARDAKYVTYAQVAREIHVNLFSPAELGRKTGLLTEIQGKKLFVVDFSFSDASLARYFEVENESGDTCHVKHIDTQIDDFDNG